MTARIIRVAGSLVEATPLRAALYDTAAVGERRMMAEVIRQRGDVATLQVYEDTTGLAVGEPVESLGVSLTAQLGPGLLGSVLDGVGRPLQRLADVTGDFITPGARVDTLDATSQWAFIATRRAGEVVRPGDAVGHVVEPSGREHPILVPPRGGGTIAAISSATVALADPVGRYDDGSAITLAHRWPVRVPRPIASRMPTERPFITGQRVFDLFFPVAEGGNAVVPGGFGTGKTIIEQSLAKYADTDIVVYVGCGERGNEMTDVLTEFPTLVDARTGRPVMERAVLIVNTSNMPVAAREASIYLGITVSEYFRDQGNRVVLMIDSASRWAEALREMAARLQEMPGEEGYPTYLANRLGQFFERAGCVRTLGEPAREGAVTVIGAVSPPGGDFSEPVTQASLRVAGAMWALDAALAHQRHFPAVDWETSFSLYAPLVSPWLAAHAAADWAEARAALMALLQRDRELRDIAGLVGPDALEDADRLVIDASVLVRETVLRQNAYHPHDARSSLAKTHGLASAALAGYRAAAAALAGGVAYASVDLSGLRHALSQLRDAPDEDVTTLAAAAMTAATALAPETVPVPAAGGDGT
ncbi:MAG: V-type ATP synthase subunit A [Gemmatimonadota bacterium]|nr:V-type ATP synthase subunit A [Gemmatimonadota bacterium]